MRNIILSMFLVLLAITISAESVAHLSYVKGKVIVQSGAKISKGKKLQSLNNGDLVLTKQGSAKIVFKDGAQMNVRPFSTIRIKQSQDKVTKKKFRKVSCLSGKFRFKSGKRSKVKNYLQTPTMVCGLRGTEVEISATLKRRRVGVISKFSGTVLLQSGLKRVKVKNTPQLVHHNDRVQTKQGSAVVTFNDGATMQIRAFSRVRIQERKEANKVGKKKFARRVTCFTGKLRFKSGKRSKIKNYLQSSNVVCGLRGTEIEFTAVTKNPQVAQLIHIEGMVRLVSEGKISRARNIGAVLHNNDLIQTRQGKAKVRFADGAILTISPFSNLLIHQKKKTQKRKVLLVTGKMRFKSSKRSRFKNYLQSPTMVCGLRGTDVTMTDKTYCVDEGQVDSSGNGSKISREQMDKVNPDASTANNSETYSFLDGKKDGENVDGINDVLEKDCKENSDALQTVKDSNQNTNSKNAETHAQELEGRLDTEDGNLDGTNTEQNTQKSAANNFDHNQGEQGKKLTGEFKFSDAHITIEGTTVVNGRTVKFTAKGTIENGQITLNTVLTGDAFKDQKNISISDLKITAKATITEKNGNVSTGSVTLGGTLNTQAQKDGTFLALKGDVTLSNSKLSISCSGDAEVRNPDVSQHKVTEGNVDIDGDSEKSDNPTESTESNQINDSLSQIIESATRGRNLNKGILLDSANAALLNDVQSAQESAANTNAGGAPAGISAPAGPTGGPEGGSQAAGKKASGALEESSDASQATINDISDPNRANSNQ